MGIIESLLLFIVLPLMIVGIITLYRERQMDKKEEQAAAGQNEKR